MFKICRGRTISWYLVFKDFGGGDTVICVNFALYSGKDKATETKNRNFMKNIAGEIGIRNKIGGITVIQNLVRPSL